MGAQMYAPMKQAQGGEFILDRELTKYIRGVGKQLAAQASRNENLNFEFSILNDSGPNAWTLPGGKIVISRGLLTKIDSEAKLAAVLGHEIGHADAAHRARVQPKDALTRSGVELSTTLFGSVDSNGTRAVAMMVPKLGAQLLTQKYGREAEWEADELGMQYLSKAGYSPLAAVELQETFVKHSQSRNQDWVSGLFLAHPPSRERLANNRKMARELPEEGSFGRAGYTARTEYLRRVQLAYDAYDEANKAVSDDDLEQARRKLNEAIAIEPRESLFHALQGDVHSLQGKPVPALVSYQKAIDTNPGFFYGFLRKGQMEYRQDQLQSAYSNLSSSLELMPTAEAHYLLGKMDKQENRLDSATDHFRVAAQSDSESGQKANRELLLLDLAISPSRYVGLKAELDENNTIWIQFGNLTQVTITNIEISYVWLDDQGQTRQGKKKYRGRLKGGERNRVNTGIKLENVSDLESRIRLQISTASVAE